MIAITLLAALYGTASAQEQVFHDDNFSFAPPAGWHPATPLPKQDGLVAEFVNEDHTMVMLALYKANGVPNYAIADKFVENYENGREKSSGFKVSSRKFIQLGGVKAYQGQSNGTVQDTPMYCLDNVVLADGNFYDLTVMGKNKQALQDPAIQKSIESFRFLVSPATPDENPGPESYAYRIGQSVGFIMMLIVALIVVRKINARKRGA